MVLAFSIRQGKHCSHDLKANEPCNPFALFFKRLVVRGWFWGWLIDDNRDDDFFAVIPMYYLPTYCCYLDTDATGS
jgi:hypothetical protein